MIYVLAVNYASILAQPIEVESTHTQFHPKQISYVLAQIQRPKSKDNFKNTVSEDNHILMLELINKAKKKYEES